MKHLTYTTVRLLAEVSPPQTAASHPGSIRDSLLSQRRPPITGFLAPRTSPHLGNTSLPQLQAGKQGTCRKMLHKRKKGRQDISGARAGALPYVVYLLASTLSAGRTYRRDPGSRPTPEQEFKDSHVPGDEGYDASTPSRQPPPPSNRNNYFRVLQEPSVW